MSNLIDIHDSEIIEIERLINDIRAETAARGIENIDRWNEDVEQRFAAIGFKVGVLWYHTNVPDVKMPEFTIMDRIEQGKEFDHDQQVHEVTNDKLGLGTGGVIKTTQMRPGEPGHKH